ncbi:PRC-barrel domain-containing protein [Thioclava sp. GXIMD2076]|uniref:PRC-barrel domain-containing protein n=1 Tax=Thioclava sp. GXIMD2076 TaxID=3131931 RepID=UPI0030D09F26
MKKLLATTAITVMAALPVMAQSTDTNAAASAQVQGNDTFFKSVPDAVMASDFIGKRVYATASTDADVTADTDMDDIGEVSDMIVGNNGDVEAVLVDVGGFLGIGKKTVAVNLDALQMVSAEGSMGSDYRLVMKGDKASLENAPAYSPAMDDMDQAANAAGNGMENAAENTTTVASDAGNDVADAAGDAADWTKEKAAAAGAAVSAAAKDAADWTKDKTAEAGTAMDQAGNDMADAADDTKADMTTAADTPANPEGTPVTDWSTVKAADLEGQTVYGPNDESIGKVTDVVTDSNDGVTQVVVSVGGFLGMGAKSVALTPDQMEVMKADDGLSIHVAATQDELEQMPAYTG